MSDASPPATPPPAAQPPAGQPESPTERPEPLRRNRDFAALLGSQAITAIGDAVSFTALPLLVLALTGSGFVMGVVGALQTLPDLVFGMLAGALADRIDRKRLIILAEIGRAALTALIPLSVLVGGPTLAVVLIVAAPMAAFRALFLAGYTSSMPSIVGRTEVGRATSILEVVYSFGYILGPAVAGALSATIGPGLTLALDAASFLVSAAGILLVRRSLAPPADRPPSTIRADIAVGIRYLAQHRMLRLAVAYWALTSVLLAPLVPALTYHVTRELGLGDAALGFVLTAFGAGTVTGAVVIARLRRAVVGPSLLVGSVALGVAVIGAAAASELPLLLAAAWLGGVGDALILITYLTLRTVASPDDLLGRIGGTARTISLGFQPLGMLAGGLAIDALGGGAALGLIGAGVVLVGLGLGALPILRHASLTGR